MEQLLKKVFKYISPSARGKSFFSRRAFTIVELLMVSVIMAIIGIVLYTMLSNGIKVWQIVNQESMQIDLNLFYERIAEDLRNCFNYDSIKFNGQDNSLSFATILHVPMRDNGFRRIVGRAGYFYEQKSKTLHQEKADLSQLDSAYTTAISQPLLQDLEMFSFQYYYYDDVKKEFFWADSWPPEKGAIQTTIAIPLAIRINAAYQDRGLLEKRSRTIAIAAGGI